MFACASAAAEQLESEFVLPVSGQSVEGHPKELMTLQVPVKVWAPHGFTMGMVSYPNRTRARPSKHMVLGHSA